MQDEKLTGIFLKLKELGITYAVAMARSELCFGDYSHNEYFIVIPRKYLPKLRYQRFKNNENNVKIVERDLNIKEQKEFRKMLKLNMFTEVVNNRNGRVYELANDSLIEKLKSQTNE